MLEHFKSVEVEKYDFEYQQNNKINCTFMQFSSIQIMLLDRETKVLISKFPQEIDRFFNSNLDGISQASSYGEV